MEVCVCLYIIWRSRIYIYNIYIYIIYIIWRSSDVTSAL